MKIVPPCITDHTKGDPSCDGDPTSVTELDRAACAWRLRCIALDRHCKVTGGSIDEHLKITEREVDGEATYSATPLKGYKSFRRFCENLVDSLGVREDNAPPARKSTAKRAEASAESGPKKRGSYSAAADRHKRMADAVDHFIKHLSGQFESWRVPTNPSAATIPGQFYVSDRMKSGYVSVYCRTASGRDIPLACAVLKPRTETINVRVGVSGVKLLKAIGAPLNKRLKSSMKSVDVGRFKAEVAGLDRDMSVVVAKAIGKMAKCGDIELPGAGC